MVFWFGDVGSFWNLYGVWSWFVMCCSIKGVWVLLLGVSGYFWLFDWCWGVDLLVLVEWGIGIIGNFYFVSWRNWVDCVDWLMGFWNGLCDFVLVVGEFFDLWFVDFS